MINSQNRPGLFWGSEWRFYQDFSGNVWFKLWHSPLPVICLLQVSHYRKGIWVEARMEVVLECCTVLPNWIAGWGHMTKHLLSFKTCWVFGVLGMHNWIHSCVSMPQTKLMATITLLINKLIPGLAMHGAAFSTSVTPPTTFYLHVQLLYALLPRLWYSSDGMLGARLTCCNYGSSFLPVYVWQVWS